MALEKNLELAKAAIHYVKQALPLGSDNRPEDDKEPERKGSSSAAQIRIAEELEEYESNRRAALRHGVKMPKQTFFDVVREIAGLAKIHKAGNCAYQAFVAFEWLLANTVIRPLAVCSIFDEKNKEKHTVILIGNYDQADAVICDSHHDQYYPLAAFLTKNYLNRPIRAYDYGCMLGLQFVRYAAGDINAQKLDPADKEYTPAQAIFYYNKDADFVEENHQMDNARRSPKR